jgi:hypothetical protein
VAGLAIEKFVIFPKMWNREEYSLFEYPCERCLVECVHACIAGHWPHLVLHVAFDSQYRNEIKLPSSFAGDAGLVSQPKGSKRKVYATPAG